jgi:hypothetical protein
MGETASTTPAGEPEDAATLKLTVETEGVQRDVTITVSPRPTDPLGWAEVVRALSDFMAAHPERFS